MRKNGISKPRNFASITTIFMSSQYKRIVLIGMRGSGKSHFSSCLAESLGWAKIDMDDEIELMAGKTIPAIIKDNGWEKFRDLEYQVTKKVSRLEKVIISTGGGAVTFERNRELLKPESLKIFLFASLKELLSRLENDTTRPALKEGKTLKEEMTEVWKERGDIYFDFADIVFHAKDGLSENNRENVEINAEVLVRKIQKIL